MKNLLFISLTSLFFLIGCQQSAAANSDFVEPEPSEWVEYNTALTEYMHHRTQAVIQNDINILWDRYPLLKENADREKGINVEKDEVDSLNNGLDIIDANFQLESYDRLKVKSISDEEAVVLVHGSIVYIRDNFEESGGEYLIKVFLKKSGDEWTVTKTDEYTLPEYKKWVENQ